MIYSFRANTFRARAFRNAIFLGDRPTPGPYLLAVARLDRSGPAVAHVLTPGVSVGDVVQPSVVGRFC